MSLRPLKCSISLRNKEFSRFFLILFYRQYFSIYDHFKNPDAIPSFFTGIICGPVWGSFAVGDHLRSNLGIISGRGSFAVSGSFAALYTTNRPFHVFFQLFTLARQQKSIDNAGKSALKAVKLPSLRVIG